MKHRPTPTDSFVSGWPIATDNEAYVQFPVGWTTDRALDWFKAHGIMKNRWGAYRPIKGTKRPLDFFVRLPQTPDEIMVRWPKPIVKEICEAITTAACGHCPDPLSKRARYYYKRLLKLMDEENL